MRRPALRVLLVVPVALALIFSWYAIRWYVGDFVAEFAPRMEEGQLEAAQAAMRLAPDDPWTHGTVASIMKRSFLPEELADAVRHYEEAVRLSPNDYRFWLELGRAREQSGDAAGGEKALRRAVELAPFYAYPRWHLGNLLLRAGRGEEAFAELRRAAEADATLRPQLFNVAWNLYGQNVDEIRRVAGDSAAARAELVIYLLGRERLEDALSIWSGLKPAEKKEQPAAGTMLAKKLLAGGRYHAAVDIMSDLSLGVDSAKSRQFVNGSFEEDIPTSGENPFNWQIKSDPQAQVAIDGSTTHGGGARSLRIQFKAGGALAFDQVSQLVLVEPSAQYRFECWVRAKDLKSAGTPLIQITDVKNSSIVFAATPPIANGTYDWQPVQINFKTPPAAEAVMVRIGRALCGGDAVCPIFGMVWYDDFNLQRVEGATAPQDKRGEHKARA